MGCGVGVGVGEPKNGAGEEVKKGLGEEWKKGAGEEPKNEGEAPKCEDGVEAKDGVTRPLSDLFLTPNLPDGFLLPAAWPMSFLKPPLAAEDLGSSAMSFWTTLKIGAALSSITPDTVVISVSFTVVIFSDFFMKSVKIWNLSSSLIRLGVVTASVAGVGRGRGRAVVCAGGSLVPARGVVKGAAVEPREPKRRGIVGRRGRNLDGNNFFLSVSTCTSLRALSSSPSRMSPCPPLPNLARPSLSLERTARSVACSSVSVSGARVGSCGGRAVVLRRREKMLRIRSCSARFLSWPLAGVLARGASAERGVVERARLGRREKSSPGLRLGGGEVASPGVTPSPASVVPASAPLAGVVRPGGARGGDSVDTRPLEGGAGAGRSVDTGREKSPSLTVTGAGVAGCLGMREKSWSGVRVLEGSLITVSSSLSSSSVGIWLKMSATRGRVVVAVVPWAG